MSAEQLTALLAKLNEDAGLREKLKGAADLDAAVVIANDAGFDVSKEDWIKHQPNQTTALSDEDLERPVGGEICTSCKTNTCSEMTCQFPDWKYC